MSNGTVLSREAKSEPPASVKDQPSFQEEARKLQFQADPAWKGHFDPSLYFAVYSPAHPTFRLRVWWVLLQSGNKGHAGTLPPSAAAGTP